MNDKQIIDLFEGFNEKKVLIVGDSMIDAYMWGHIERMSPEAPVPVVQIDTHENRLGGSANVARNIKSLGGHPILCSVIGNDEKGTLFLQLMKSENITTKGILISQDRKTTVKTRIISENKHQLRVDEENTFDISEEVDFIHVINKLISNVDVIILQDYNKGVLTSNVITKTIREAKKNSVPVIVDPKEKNYDSFRGCNIMKPNLKELKKGMNISFKNNNLEEIRLAIKNLRQYLELDSVLLTLSERGLCIETGDEFTHIPAFETNIIDVSGAGDTVISLAALCLASKTDYQDLAIISNLAGGIVCKDVGVVPIDKTILFQKLKELNTEKWRK